MEKITIEGITLTLSKGGYYRTTNDVTKKEVYAYMLRRQGFKLAEIAKACDCSISRARILVRRVENALERKRALL